MSGIEHFRRLPPAPPEPDAAPRRRLYRETLPRPARPPRLERPRVLRPGPAAALEVEDPAVEQRFIAYWREVPDDEPGLILDAVGNVYLVAPDGSRTQLPGGGGSGLPAGWTQAGDPAVVNANGGALILGGENLGNLPLLVVGDNASEKVLQVQDFDENDMLTVDTDFGGTLVFAQLGIVGNPTNDSISFAPSGDTMVQVTRSSLTPFQINTHGQTTVGAIDALAEASLVIQASGEGLSPIDAFRVHDDGGTPTVAIKPTGDTFIQPNAAATVGLYMDTTPMSRAHDAIQIVRSAVSVMEVNATGSVNIAPDDGFLDGLTVAYAAGGPAIRVGSLVGGTRVVLDDADGIEFSVCYQGSSLLAVHRTAAQFQVPLEIDPSAPGLALAIGGGPAMAFYTDGGAIFSGGLLELTGTGEIGVFDATPVHQQPAPSSAQDIADALAAYGWLGGAGTVPGPVGDSRLNLFLDASQVAPLTFVQGVQKQLPWTVVSSHGGDLSLDADTKMIHFATLGTYVLRLRWGMSTVLHGTQTVVLLCNLSGSAIVGGDSIQSAVPIVSGTVPDPTTSWLWRVNAGATLILGGQISGGSGDETAYDITLDIVRVA